uniref:Transmembrane protein 127 transmembrane region domain-containing protein n=1 Tax=Timema genevievae TaxID=629358 RepID=A0A7R9JUA4_TIMGE|nr:unnamed protein product [Timema genevievae]
MLWREKFHCVIVVDHSATMYATAYYPRHRWHLPKEHDRNFVAAFFHMATIALTCTSLAQLGWFHIRGGQCSPHLAVYQFFNLGYMDSDPQEGAVPVTLHFYPTTVRDLAMLVSKELYFRCAVLDLPLVELQALLCFRRAVLNLPLVELQEVLCFRCAVLDLPLVELQALLCFRCAVPDLPLVELQALLCFRCAVLDLPLVELQALLCFRCAVPDLPLVELQALLCFRCAVLDLPLVELQALLCFRCAVPDLPLVELQALLCFRCAVLDLPLVELQALLCFRCAVPDLPLVELQALLCFRCAVLDLPLVELQALLCFRCAVLDLPLVELQALLCFRCAVPDLPLVELQALLCFRCAVLDLPLVELQALLCFRCAVPDLPLVELQALLCFRCAVPDLPLVELQALLCVVCATPEIATLMRLLILLCFMAMISSLVGFFLDIVGPTKKIFKIIRRNSVPSIFTVVWVVVIVGICYYVSIRLTTVVQNMNPESEVQVSYEYGCYTITAAGVVAVIASACNLFQPHSSSVQEIPRRRLVEDWEGPESFVISGPRLVDTPLESLPPPPYTP